MVGVLYKRERGRAAVQELFLQMTERLGVDRNQGEWTDDSCVRSYPGSFSRARETE